MDIDIEFKPLGSAIEPETEIRFEDLYVSRRYGLYRTTKKNVETLYGLLTGWRYLPSRRCIVDLNGFTVIVDGKTHLIYGISIRAAQNLRERLRQVLRSYEFVKGKRSSRSSFARILRHINEAKPNIEAYFNREDPTTQVESVDVTPIKVPWFEKPKYKKSRLEQMIEQEHSRLLKFETTRLKKKRSKVGLTALGSRPGYSRIELEDILGDAMGSQEPTPAYASISATRVDACD